MRWLLEQPLPTVIVGIVAVVILGSGWIRTGRKALIVALVVVAVLTGVLVLVERVVVTDREAVDATLHQIARDVESNDLNRVLRHVHSSAHAVRREAAAKYPQYRFESVRIKHNLEIHVDPHHVPPKAVAEFNVTVDGTDRHGQFGLQSVPRFVTVVFYKEEDGRWRVASYKHENPQEGFMKRD